MKPSYFLLLPAFALAISSCTSIPTETESIVKAEEGVPGGEITDITTFKATVTGIDASKRKVTLVSKEGKKLNFTAGPEVRNFDQIEIGDQLTVSLTETSTIRMAKPGEKVDDIAYGTVDLPPVGAKPGLKMSDTYQSSAKVSAIDEKKRKVTLEFPDGSTEKITVRDDLNLAERKVGELVVIRSSEVYEINLEKP
jgi:Cu/Ag efflux protein CusF